ncbi:uncharacterized protein TRUGW13939_08735 [Talaromyces rugulosus]|uniref:Fatty acid hydroxylase domain-containing protein n=1 Tax=Talaromyces rugulosus TaxID=121627 RepID=A0A7H8RAB0_TALRU|nr:uncharacterized protein TRUGW13939_08735 [Talaromyces rugulosus]QKX61583.1 hypothetical protein TRUGW13939_08735 [Talaromyces rugulosus]
MQSNSSLFELPPLPSYTLSLRQPVLAPIPDNLLSLLLPVIAYWAVSMVFHFIDVNDYFSKYRLHTPAELLKRNHVSRIDVVRDVLLQHAIQTVAGLMMSVFDGPEYVGHEEYDVAVWARRVRIMQRAIPTVLGFVGIDSIALSKTVSDYPALSGFLAGGLYPGLVQTLTLHTGQQATAPAHAAWEFVFARFIYSYLIPALQFFFAILTVDTWQYFWHRAMHVNRWLYVNFHSRHHRLYVPYAFGALYNHPVEGFLLDTAGTGVAFLLTQMSHRQAMWFFTMSTIKTVDDHCGYHFPWDPLQLITSNNSAYHDIHHQSWGIKTNFSQPFFTFWDRFMGTRWQGDVSRKYERARTAAEAQVERERTENNGQSVNSVLESEPGPLDAFSQDVSVQERAPRKILPRTTRSASTRSHGVNGSIRQK